MNDNLGYIGDRIREKRKNCGYSQESFALSMNIGRSYMGRVERGEQNLSVKLIMKIAKRLNVEVGALFPSLKNISDL